MSSLAAICLAEFLEALMSAANEQVAQYGPAGRGNIKTAAGGEWTNIGPDRSNWIQNGVRVNESDTGRVRNFLVHPTNADIVYVLKSSGGLWKTTNFSHPRPNWRPMSDYVLSTSGGSVAFGKDPETLYLGTGDPFDPGVGGYIYKSTDGGETWSAGVKLGDSTIVPDVKVDTSGAADVVLAGTNRGPVPFRRWRRDVRPPVLPGAFRSGASRRAALAGSQRWRKATATNFRCWRRSTNLGLTWGVVATASNVYTGAGRITLAVASPGDATVYAFASTTNSAARRICTDHQTAA